MTSTTRQERLPSDRAHFGVRRWILTLLAATLLLASGNAMAQIPALPVSADHRSDIGTPVGTFSADKHGNVARVCAEAYPSVPALPVRLPVAIPGASAGACIGADLDQLRADARSDANLYGLSDPTGLAPSRIGLGIGADADDRDLEMDADTDASTAQQALNTVTDAIKSAWSVVRGLF